MQDTAYTRVDSNALGTLTYIYVTITVRPPTNSIGRGFVQHSYYYNSCCLKLTNIGWANRVNTFRAVTTHPHLNSFPSAPHRPDHEQLSHLKRCTATPCNICQPVKDFINKSRTDCINKGILNGHQPEVRRISLWGSSGAPMGRAFIHIHCVSRAEPSHDQCLFIRRREILIFKSI